MAPANGKITAVSVSEGQVVETGDNLATLEY